MRGRRRLAEEGEYLLQMKPPNSEQPLHHLRRDDNSEMGEWWSQQRVCATTSIYSAHVTIS